MTNRPLLPVLLCATMLLGNVSRGHAQEPILPTRAWEGELRYKYDSVSDNRVDWRKWTLSITRDLSAGALTGSLVRNHRFGLVEDGGSLNLWHDLWFGTYGQLGIALNPSARALPRSSLTGTLYKSLGSWEVSSKYNWRRYGDENVHIFDLGLSRYLGSWYLRATTTLAPRPTKLALTQRLGGRRLYESASTTSYVEVEAGFGRNVELVGPAPIILVTQHRFASVKIRHFFASRFALTASLRWSDDDVYRRLGGSIGAVVQW